MCIARCILSASAGAARTRNFLRRPLESALYSTRKVVIFEHMDRRLPKHVMAAKLYSLRPEILVIKLDKRRCMSSNLIKDTSFFIYFDNKYFWMEGVLYSNFSVCIISVKCFQMRNKCESPSEWECDVQVAIILDEGGIQINAKATRANYSCTERYETRTTTRFN